MKKATVRAILILSGVLAVLVFLLALYKAIYFAWLTATPLDSDELARCQHYYYYCLTIAILSLVGACILFWHAARKRA